MVALSARLYIARAADFYAGVDILRLDLLYRHSAALLAIHSAISYSDALRFGLGDTRLYADNHLQAVSTLRKLLLDRGITDHSGLTHFEFLISRKTDVAYSGRRLDEKTFLLIASKAERFANWISRTAARLKLEGWSNDD